MSGDVVIITEPDSNGASTVDGPRVKVTIEYNPPEFADAATIKQVTRKLRKRANKIVAEFG